MSDSDIINQLQLDNSRLRHALELARFAISDLRQAVKHYKRAAPVNGKKTELLKNVALEVTRLMRRVEALEAKIE